MSDPRLRVAHHESGHAVVAWLLSRGRMPEGAVSIRPSAHFAGVAIVGSAPPPAGVGASLLCGPLLGERHHGAEVAAVIALAGPLAEDLFDLRPSRFEHPDEAHAERIIRAAALSDAEAAELHQVETTSEVLDDSDAAASWARLGAGEALAPAWLGYLRAAARSMVSAPPVWALIEALARTLTVAEVMSPEATKRVLEEASWLSVRTYMEEARNEKVVEYLSA